VTEVRAFQNSYTEKNILFIEAKNLWKQGILARSKDHGIARVTRISLTFRNVNKMV
jgi:hypothetical protein